ncbi:MAG: hypothetical protein AAB457_01145 [Patescibacteria group bacterium]
MGKLLDRIVWGFLLTFAVPTIMVVVSWNSVPGDSTYGMKRALEQTLLVLASPSYETKGNLQVKYTERRFSEASRLLADKASVEGLIYLNDQLAITKTVITEAPNAKVQKELATNYIETLTKLSGQLEKQKQTVAGTTSTPAPVRQELAAPIAVQPEQQTVPARAAPTAIPIVTAPPVAPALRTSPNRPEEPAKTAMAVAEISQTQVQIQQTIKEMEHVAREAEKKERKEEKKAEESDKKSNDKKDEKKTEKE